MKLFDFLKKKKTFSNEEIEAEYQKAKRKSQSDDARRFSLIKAIQLHAEKHCSPQAGDDLLAKKADFIRYCSFIARNSRYYYSLHYKKGKFSSYPFWTQKWQDHEQQARLKAQKRWREITSHTR